MMDVASPLLDLASRSRQDDSVYGGGVPSVDADAVPADASGDCDLCGSWASRLSEGVCPVCEHQYARSLRG